MSFDFSLVIPCYNEHDNLRSLFEKVFQLFDHESKVEVLLVNNGSTDGSKEEFESLLQDQAFNKSELLEQKENQIRVLTLEQNQGYGGGIIAGLKSAQGKFLAWTHADLQTDPNDFSAIIKIIKEHKEQSNLFIKGKRYGRPLFDVFFTIGMGIFESVLFGASLFDINAQPTCFSREFFETWQDYPTDFSLDLYAFVLAKKRKQQVYRTPVYFGKRLHGESKWNVDFRSKLKFIKRTLDFSFELRKKKFK